MYGQLYMRLTLMKELTYNYSSNKQHDRRITKYLICD